MKKGKWPTRQLKNIYRLVPLSTPATCRWTVPLKGQSHRFEDDATHLCFCDPVPGKLDDGEIAPPYGPLDLVEADHEGGGGGAAHPHPLHGGEPSALGTNHTITSNPLNLTAIGTVSNRY